MQNQNLSVYKTLNPTLSTLQSPSLTQFFNPLHRTLPPIPITSTTPKRLSIQSHDHKTTIFRRDVRSFAGRKKENSGGGRIEGSAEFRRQAKRNARRKSKKLTESLFYRLKNPQGNYPDNFSEEELQMIGLGYDRMVRFMEKDDPNLKHPYDWYKYGQFGPYSWRGVVLGEPIRGRFSDECVSMIGEVKDQEEWEKIEQHEMAQEFQNRLDAMDKNVGFRYFWVFVRHPKWRISEFPWQQWTLVSEVVVEAGNQRLDKWNLMGRLGNKARSLITQCASWMRPDIVYVQRPVYQCRFEPQDDFFKALTPLLDPESEDDFLFELEDDKGRVELCTYFGGLCKIVRVNPKSFVDDVVKAFEKLNDEKKSKCLGFLLDNHPVPLLHPYTKEWKAKLEDMEMGCDAPDDDDDDYGSTNNKGETEIVDWIEDDEDEDQYDVELDASGDEDDEDGDSSQEEDARFWDDEFKKALGSNQAMEKFATKYMETTTKFYEKHINAMDEREKEVEEDGGDELAMRGVRAKVSPKEWENLGFGPFRRKLKKGKMPPELFMKAAVRPFTYRNLVKEIVLTRHAILEGEIGQKK
ncbi:hypothetical protein K7X08_012241 [Anisodus acutangulus]|uniref:Uncharacterized protein n=1 Tax=Anisodus acutangulus TaxID=402998 RepID=A0A9Q1L9Y6_9SOLA|nr:hypothetical protein K7X08_012241 [Anisodus acutangulus]